MRKNAAKLAVVLLGVALFATACGNKKNASDSSSTSMAGMAMGQSTSTTPGLLSIAASHMSTTADVLAGGIAKQYPDKFAGDPDSAGAKLRADLTAELQEHVYLAGDATGAALAGKDNSTEVAALDANSVALSEAIKSVYGDAAGTEFLALWRKHIGFFVDYTVGKAKNDVAMQTKAKSDLDGYRNDFGAFLAAANPNLTKEAVAADLTHHVQTLLDAIDAQAAKSPDATAKLETAAEHMPMTADILAGAIVKQFPDKFAGDPDATSSTLRSNLTSELQAHVYLAAYATGTALEGADNSSQVAALDANSVALSKAIGSVYGDAAGTEFLALWRKHIGFFVDYTVGKATDDQAKTTKAMTDLDGYRADFGAFLSAANPNLPKDAVAEDLKPHVQSLIAVIDSKAKDVAAKK